MKIGSRKRLEDIRDDFELGVFLSVYQSPRQRLHHRIARCILGLKHGLRAGYPGRLLFPGSFQS